MRELLKTTTSLVLAAAAFIAFVPEQWRTVAAAAQDLMSDSAAIVVQVQGFTVSEGVVEIGLYASQAGWDADEALTERVGIVDGVAQVRFESLRPGPYAIRLFHDVNADGAFNTNLMGIPSEPYGFSNNPRPRFRGARFDEAVFTLEAGEVSEQVVTLTRAGG